MHPPLEFVPFVFAMELQLNPEVELTQAFPIQVKPELQKQAFGPLLTPFELAIWEQLIEVVC